MRSALARKKVSTPKKPLLSLVGGTVVGNVVMAPLARFKPNDWNPNVMTSEEVRGLRHGMKTRGWIASQALLIWGTNEKGVRQDIIIDGEHRWEVAVGLKFVDGPVVVIDGITRAQAMALTIELDQKRGKFTQDRLGVAVRFIAEMMPSETLAIDLGFTEKALKFLVEPSLGLVDESVTPLVSSDPNRKQVPLFFDLDAHDAFMRAVDKLVKRAPKGKPLTLSDVVLKAVLSAAE